MNSLLQQLYHVQDFSLQLLGLVPDRRVEGDQINSSPQEEDKVLLQLQVRFLEWVVSEGQRAAHVFPRKKAAMIDWGLFVLLRGRIYEQPDSSPWVVNYLVSYPHISGGRSSRLLPASSIPQPSA